MPVPVGIVQRGVWSIEKNDELALDYDRVQKTLKAVKASGDFDTDFTAYCEVLNIIPHPQMKAQMPMVANPNPGEAKAAEAKEADGDAQELSVMVMVRNHQIDLASRQALLATLPGVVSMLDLTFYNASLNAADISALAKILNTTAIATLKIEYNPFDFY